MTSMHDDENRDRWNDRPDDVAALIRGAGPRPEAPSEIEGRVREVVESHWREGVRQRRRRRWLATAMLAAAVLVAALLAGGLRVWQPARTVALVERSLATGPGAGTRMVAGSVVEVKEGSGVALRMSHGASLRLDAGTRVILRSSEEVFLDEGGLYFDSSGRDAPMAVETRLGVVRNRGTQFEARIDDDALSVRVREGAVTVTGETRKAELVAGEALRCETGVDWARYSATTHGEAWSWVAALTPAFSLEDQNLDAFLTWASRESGLELVYASDGLEAEAADVSVQGSIETLTPLEAIDAVLPTTGLRFALVDGVLRVGEPIDREWSDEGREMVFVATIFCVSHSFVLAEGVAAEHQKLSEVLDALQEQGVPILYSSRLVRPDMLVDEPPSPLGVSIETLNELLAPYELEVRPGPKGALMIVRRAPAERDPETPAEESHPESRSEPLPLPSRLGFSERVEVSSTRLLTLVAGERRILDGASASELPGSLGSVFRTLDTLPGVNSTGELGSAISIRGAPPSANLIVLDGVELYKPTRLFGISSAFYPRIIESFSLDAPFHESSLSTARWLNRVRASIIAFVCVQSPSDNRQSSRRSPEGIS